MPGAEAAGEYADVRVQPGELAMPDTFKVQLGKVGGYRNYLGPESIAFVDVALA
jgi:hypothetical protein